MELGSIRNCQAVKNMELGSICYYYRKVPRCDATTQAYAQVQEKQKIISSLRCTGLYLVPTL